jgi:hypothetical protein
MSITSIFSKNIFTKRISAGAYDVFDANTKAHIGEIHKTGTHLDHYPWEWYFDHSVYAHGAGRRTGVEESYRAAKDAMNFRYGLLLLSPAPTSHGT